MARKHFDVVVLGAGLGPLFAAAVLARRSFRVRVLGQRWLPPRYGYVAASAPRWTTAGVPPEVAQGPRVALARRPFQLLCQGSPLLARFLLELAQGQTLRRATRYRDPMFQVFFPDARLDVSPDPERFREEIRREFPEIEGAVDELYGQLAAVNGALDDALRGHAIVPPTSFWDRRAAGRLERELTRALRSPDPLAPLPEGHPYRQVAIVSAAFGSSYGAVLPPLALARLHGAWTRGVVAVDGGEEGMIAFLLDRIRAHGGEVSLEDRAVRLITDDDRVTHVEDDSGDEPCGAGHVLFDGSLPEVLDLATAYAPTRGALGKFPELFASEGRFVVSVEVGRAGLPEALADNVFLLPSQEEDLAPVWVQREAGSTADSDLLVLETMLPVDAVLRGRRFVLSVLERHFPFVERHYRVVDSPNDGLPLWDFRPPTDDEIRLEAPTVVYLRDGDGVVRYLEVERTALTRDGGPRDPEPLRARWVAEYPAERAPLRAMFPGRGGEGPVPLGWAGLATHPFVTPLANVFLGGETVFPTLGQEGELLAAWSVAARITATDPYKERLRKELWSKLEPRP